MPIYLPLFPDTTDDMKMEKVTARQRERKQKSKGEEEKEEERN